MRYLRAILLLTLAFCAVATSKAQSAASGGSSKERQAFSRLPTSRPNSSPNGCFMRGRRRPRNYVTLAASVSPTGRTSWQVWSTIRVIPPP